MTWPMPEPTRPLSNARQHLAVLHDRARRARRVLYAIQRRQRQVELLIEELEDEAGLNMNYEGGGVCNVDAPGFRPLGPFATDSGLYEE